jgi:hypothetical protein
LALSRSRVVAGVVLIVALALGLGSGAVVSPEADAIVSASTLTVVHGAVLISHAGAEFTLAREGDVVKAGDTVRTRTGAAAEITYFEGSSVRLEADSEIVLQGLRASHDGPVLTVERAWHVVTKLFAGGSRYEMHAPSSTASVRG